MARTILAVDDSATMRTVLELTFGGLDFLVVMVGSASDALQKLEEEPTPDLVIVDLSLAPMNGYDLCKAIKNASPSTPVVILSSRQNPFEVDKGDDARADGHIDKPFDAQDMIDLVHALLGITPAAGARSAATPPALDEERSLSFAVPSLQAPIDAPSAALAAAPERGAAASAPREELLQAPEPRALQPRSAAPAAAAARLIPRGGAGASGAPPSAFKHAYPMGRPSAGAMPAIAKALIAPPPAGSASPVRGALAKGEVAARRSEAIEARASGPAPYLDENVQFTVYRPRVVQPGRWYPLLAFAHLSERREGAPDEPDPVEEMLRQAEQALGEKARDYVDVTQDSRFAVPAEGEITFVPEIAGVTFNPPRRSFRWQETVHKEEIRLRASAELDGTTARGRLSVFLGSILLAEVSLSLRVDARPLAAAAGEGPPEATRARVYRKIFASYSHKDLAVVNQFEQYARALGDEYLRDWIHLRTGEVWTDRLKQLIEQADVFQLFWSASSMRSPFVRQEWEHALALGRPHFVRPMYWEQPMPELPEQDLPPEALRRLHFQRIGAEGDESPEAESAPRPGVPLPSPEALSAHRPDAPLSSALPVSLAVPARASAKRSRIGLWIAILVLVVAGALLALSTSATWHP